MDNNNENKLKTIPRNTRDFISPAELLRKMLSFQQTSQDHGDIIGTIDVTVDYSVLAFCRAGMG